MAVALGLAQGATEFLPVSSSGHMVVMSMLWDAPPPSLELMVLLHLATLLATLLVFRNDLWALGQLALRALRSPSLLRDTDEGRLLVRLLAATFVTAVVGLGLEPFVERWSGLRWLVGTCFVGSALALLATRSHYGQAQHLPVRAALLVGLAQGLAALPGLSRSGVTIATAMWLGMSPTAAFRFSFLMSVPVVAGASVLELGKPGATSALGLHGLIGAGTALLSGYTALLGLRALVARGRLWAFALYLIPLGATMLLMDLVTEMTDR